MSAKQNHNRPDVAKTPSKNAGSAATTTQFTTPTPAAPVATTPTSARVALQQLSTEVRIPEKKID